MRSGTIPAADAACAGQLNAAELGRLDAQAGRLCHRRQKAAAAALSAGLVSLGMLVGCAERTVYITSEPSGALVWVNDKELGRTPLSSAFTYYGTYDVRLRLEGYEPLRTSAKADTPIYEFPPLDLASEAVPGGVETKVRWHFVMQPSLESTMQGEELRAEVIRRAREMAGQTQNESSGTSGEAETPVTPPAETPAAAPTEAPASAEPAAGEPTHEAGPTPSVK